MSDATHIVCPHCSSTNRVPTERLADRPNCGVCKEALFTAQPVEIDQQGFERQIRDSGIPVVVDFWAPWCGPCKMMAPVFEQAAAQMEPRVRFTKINTDQEQDLAARFNIRSIPTVAVFRGGREVARQAGAMDGRRLTAWIDQQLR